MDIITVRMHGAADNSPLEMISAARLAYLLRVEAAAKDLVAALRFPEGHAGPPLGPSRQGGSSLE